MSDMTLEEADSRCTYLSDKAYSWDCVDITELQDWLQEIDYICKQHDLYYGSYYGDNRDFPSGLYNGSPLEDLIDTRGVMAMDNQGNCLMLEDGWPIEHVSAMIKD